MKCGVLFMMLMLYVLGGVFGQPSDRDFQIWENLEMEIPVNKRWMGEFQGQSRIVDNSQEFGYYSLSAGALFRITKDLRLSTNYTFGSKRRDDESYKQKNQTELNLTYRKKLGEWVVFNRVSGVMRLPDFFLDEKNLHDFYCRHKITIRYKHFRNITPYISEETSYKFDGKYYERGINRIRVSGGLLFKINDSWLTEISYILELNRDEKIPLNNHVLSIGLVKTFFQ